MSKSWSCETLSFEGVTVSRRCVNQGLHCAFLLLLAQALRIRCEQLQRRGDQLDGEVAELQRQVSERDRLLHLEREQNRALTRQLCELGQIVTEEF